MDYCQGRLVIGPVQLHTDVDLEPHHNPVLAGQPCSWGQVPGRGLLGDIIGSEAAARFLICGHIVATHKFSKFKAY